MKYFLYINIYESQVKAMEPLPCTLPSTKTSTARNPFGIFQPMATLSIQGKIYTLMKIAGSGSSGVVYYARQYDKDSESVRKVAIKIFLNVKRLFNQAKKEGNTLTFIQKGVPCPHIITLLDQFFIKNHYCLVMPALGLNLWQYMQTHRLHFSLANIAKIAKQVLTALAHIHKKKYVYLDIKPENIVFVKNGQMNVKLVDFGLVRPISFLRGTAKKTKEYWQARYYRAPELAFKQYDALSTKIDIWSLGCALTEVYTGDPLFDSKNQDELMEKMHTFFKCVKAKKYLQHVLFRDEEIQKAHHSFIDFISQMIKGNPRMRPSAKELLKHPFLK